MPVARLLVIERDRLPDDVTRRAFMSDHTMVPVPTAVIWDGNCLQVEWSATASAYCHLPWRIRGTDDYFLATATLLSRGEPYLLSLELARGTLARARQWWAEWQRHDVPIPARVTTLLAESLTNLRRSACRQHDPVVADHHAIHALRGSWEALRCLGCYYSEQMLWQSSQQVTHSLALLGARVDTASPRTADRPLCRVAQTLSIPAPRDSADNFHDAWRLAQQLVEKASGRRQHVLLGPLCSGVDNGLAGKHDGQSPALPPQGLRPLTSLGPAEQLSTDVDLWYVMADCDQPPVEGRFLPARLQGVSQAVAAARAGIPDGMLMIGIGQPWGEYLASEKEASPVPPFALAQSIVRAGLGLSALGLLFRFGRTPGSSGRRDALMILRMVDGWSRLGLPLVIFLEVELQELQGPSGPSWLSWVNGDLLPLLVCQHTVMAVVWNGIYVSARDELQGTPDAWEGRLVATYQSLQQARRQAAGQGN